MSTDTGAQSHGAMIAADATTVRSTRAHVSAVCDTGRPRRDHGTRARNSSNLPVPTGLRVTGPPGPTPR